MCDPATAIMVVKGVTAVAGAASSVEKTNNKNQRYSDNVAASKDAYFLKTKQANLRIIQEQTQASQKLQDADLKAMQSQGTAIAAAGGAGVQGVNVDQLINDFERSEGVLADRTMQKLENIQAQNEITKLGYQSEAISRINSIQPVGYAEAMFGVIEPLGAFAIDTVDYNASRADAQGEPVNG